ncbi:hypothetical protein HS125_17845 [bacterium]|nr:hypothetical protein [bacterium]
MVNNPREKLLLSLTLVAAFSFLGTWVYRDIAARFQIIEDQIAEMERRLDTYRRLAEERKTKEEKYRQVMAEVNLGTDKIIVVQDQLTQLLNESGIKLERGVIRPVPASARKDEQFESITFAVTNVQASLEQLMRFLYLLNDRSTVLEVSSIVIEADPRDDQAPLKVSVMNITRLSLAAGAAGARSRR